MKKEVRQQSREKSSIKGQQSRGENKEQDRTHVEVEKKEERIKKGGIPGAVFTSKDIRRSPPTSMAIPFFFVLMVAWGEEKGRRRKLCNGVPL